MFEKKSVLVTGGASFIGSHLVDALVRKNAKVRVVDDLSSGIIENIKDQMDQGNIEFIEADLKDPSVTRKAVKNIDILFHLAADHGGRGYIGLHQIGPATNLFLDGMVFWEAYKAGVERITFASSGCVYPVSLQSNPEQEVYLTEDLVTPPYESDELYGWAKLMAELTLKAYHEESGMKTSSCRYFTAYGPRCLENHAVMAMIARAYVKQAPFEIWGDGTQVRNWTYIDDIVEGTLLAAEKIEDGTAVNLGTMERIQVVDAAKLIMYITGHKAEIDFKLDMPTGPLNRVADNSLAKKLLGWEPEIPFKEGVEKTIDWYFSKNTLEDVEYALEHKLTER